MARQPVPRSAIICTPCQILERSNLDDGHVAGRGQKTGAHRIFVGKLGRMKCRWDDNYNGDGDANNNRMDVKETGWESVEWIHLFQDSNQ